MFPLTRPPEDEIQRFISEQSGSRFSYPEVGASAPKVPKGYNVDHNRIELGRGEAAWHRAVEAIQGWQTFNMPWDTSLLADCADTGRNRGRAVRWLTALASLAVGAAFFALWFWLLPQWLGFSVEMVGAARWRWLAAVPSVLGFAVALRCVWDFGWTGCGTPAPVAPPKHLVVVGFYRYVRNPMYVGFAAGWIGLWVVFGHANPLAIAAVVAVALGVHLFVVFYEEPTLRRKFGTDHEEYCRNVRRWWPRLRGWEKAH